MDCKNYEKNKSMCNCTYSACNKTGFCCECLHYHRKMGQLPACYFSATDEKSYDRSIEKFIDSQKNKYY